MQSVDTLLSNIDTLIVNPLIYLLFAIALIVFLWGVVQFIVNADNEEGRNKGKRNILWGLVGMFIMVSAFGIITIIIRTFGISPNAIQSVSGQ